MGVVLGSSGALSNVWCSRRELDGHVSTTDRGQALLLEMSTRSSDLQALLDAWQHQEHVHALSDQQDLVPVQIGRYCGGRKNQAPLLFTEDVAVPVFSQGMRCLHTFYRPVAAVIHLGPECKSGHYRSLLRLGDDWFYSDDNRPAERCMIEREHRGNVCYLWLVRSRLLNALA